MHKLLFLKNYFFIFFITYLVILFTKLLFVFYLYDTFSSLSTKDIIYALFWGIKFDLAVASVLTLIVTFFDFHKKTLIMISIFSIGFLFLAQVSDIFYFYESSRHMGYEVSDALTDASGLLMTALSQHTFLSSFALLFVIALTIFLWIYLSSKLISIKITKFIVLQKLILILISVFFVRGMTQSIPLNPWQSNQIGDQKLSSLALNGSYNALYAIANKSKKLKPLPIPQISDEDISYAFKELYQKTNTTNEQILKTPNIVFLFLESWSAVNIKSYGFTQSTTPFFDEILTKSIRPTAMLAGGHRTTEGIFASLSSFQNPLGKSIAKTQLQDYEYISLITLLKKHSNYSSAFFQGSSKETSGTGSLVQTLGFEESYGKKDIQKRIYEENYWGVHDPDLYNFTLEKASQLKQPFILGINGATTHDDKIPEGIQKQDFVQNEKLNNQLNALHFSDAALKEFVQNVEEKYPNTLFVFVADHCGGVKGSSFENYLIPFALYHKDLEPKAIDAIISQRDIYPTIVDLLYEDTSSYIKNSSGKSLISSDNFFADYYHNGILGWLENDLILEINLATEEKTCYKIENFKNIKIQCTQEILNFKNRALAFTNISQKLLFEGKTKSFTEYKNAE